MYEGNKERYKVDKIIQTMKNIRIAMIVTMWAIGACTVFSQSHLDAFKYGQSDLSGTARYLGMGGAFGALGGDISVMDANPAGLAVYRTSEVVATLNLTSTATATDWMGTSLENSNRTKLNFDNIAYIGYFPTSNETGIVSWNAGFSYNRLKNYNRSYTISTANAPHSLSDNIAELASEHDVYDLEHEKGSYNAYLDGSADWLSVLGYNAGIIDYFNNQGVYASAFGNFDGAGYHPYSLGNASLQVSERGSTNRYNFAFGMNISNHLFLGSSMSVTDIDYSFSSQYDEKFTNDDDFYLDNGLSTKGSGFSVNVGAILRLGNLRLGAAYNSPVWYEMTDYFYGEAASSVTIPTLPDEENPRKMLDNTPSGSFYEYSYTSPDKWLFSAAYIFGQTALISMDYELTNSDGMRLFDRNGNSSEFMDVNNDIRNQFNTTKTFRVGAELKLTPQFALRIGSAKSSSGMDINSEVITAGTIPHFTVDRGTQHFTYGAGYRFTPSFYMDLSLVHTQTKENAVAFVDKIVSDGNTVQAASLKTNRTRAALTFGYKF
jgi:hypothetical protein